MDAEEYDDRRVTRRSNDECRRIAEDTKYYFRIGRTWPVYIGPVLRSRKVLTLRGEKPLIYRVVNNEVLGNIDAKTELLDRIPRFERFFRLLLQHSLATLQSRWHASVTHTAEQRYNSFLLDYPSVAQRITQTQIARFIGVSPEFLSKMRSLMYRRVS